MTNPIYADSLRKLPPERRLSNPDRLKKFQITQAPVPIPSTEFQKKGHKQSVDSKQQILNEYRVRLQPNLPGKFQPAIQKILEKTFKTQAPVSEPQTIPGIPQRNLEAIVGSPPRSTFNMPMLSVPTDVASNPTTPASSPRLPGEVFEFEEGEPPESFVIWETEISSNLRRQMCGRISS